MLGIRVKHFQALKGRIIVTNDTCRLDHLLHHMTVAEKRRMRRTLNGDTTISISYADLPTEVVADILDYLGTKDIIVMLIAYVGEAADTQQRKDNWLSEIYRKLSNGAFRGYISRMRAAHASSENRSLPTIDQEATWLIQASRDFLDRQDGWFHPDILKHMSPINAFHQKYHSFRQFTRLRGTLHNPEHFMKVLDARDPARKETFLRIPGRGQIRQWSVSDRLLVAVDDSRRRLHAWKLGLPYNEQIPAPATKQLPSILCSKVTTLGNKVGFLLEGKLHIWDLDTNLLSSRALPGTIEYEYNSCMLFHPIDPARQYAIALEKSELNKDMLRLSSWTFNGSILLGKQSIELSERHNNFRVVSPKPADLSGTFLIAFADMEKLLWNLVYFINPYTGVLYADRIDYANKEVVKSSVNRYWEGVMTYEDIEQLYSNLTAGDMSPQHLRIEKTLNHGLAMRNVCRDRHLFCETGKAYNG